MHHIIGSAIGGVVTYLLLVLLVPGQPPQQFLTAVVIGAIVAMIWPWFIAFMLARRVKKKRDANIQDEVARQVADKT